jgi:hypothetical protein
MHVFVGVVWVRAVRIMIVITMGMGMAMMDMIKG